MIVDFRFKCLVCFAKLTAIAILLLGTANDAFGQKELADDSPFLSSPYKLSFADFGFDAIDAKGTPSDSAPVGGMIATEDAIVMFEKRAKQNSKDYASRTVLGELYLRKAKEKDHLESYSLAETVLKEALQINPGYESARLNLARALMAQHQFAHAIEYATPVGGTLADKLTNLAVVSDCHLELGNYEKARRLLDQLRSKEESAPVLARFARLEEIHGNVKKAIQLLDEAIFDLAEVGANRDEQAWYEWRLASLLFDTGKLDSAESQVRQVLKDRPDEEPCQILLAKILFAKGDSDQALATMQQALAINQSPPSMAMMGDLYMSRGDSSKADFWWSKAEQCIVEEAKVAKLAHAREAALFYADHDRNLAEALVLISDDLGQRKDVHAYDALAWIQFKNGKNTEALKSLQQALVHNTRDSMIHYHAAKIHYAAGEFETAKQYLQRIVDINPRFSIAHASDIKRLSVELGIISNN